MSNLSRASRLALVLAILGPVSAFAQDSSKTGLVIGSSSVGIIFPAGDRAAIRPEFAFAWAKSTPVIAPAGTESTTRQPSPGVSLLIYTGKWDGLRAYVSPQYVYRRATAKTTSPLGSADSTGTSHTISGCFGADYAVHPRFAIFGEAGLNYVRANSDSGKSSGVNTIGRVGAVFYFK